MSSEDSVTGWIEGLKQGDRETSQKLWQRFYDRLVRLARRNLKGARKGMSDEEDVALSALDSFYRAAEQDRFPKLFDRHDLWRILMSITLRKAVDMRRHENRAIRGGGNVHGDSAFGEPDWSTPDGFARLISKSPPPELALIWSEEFGRLLDKLDDDRLRSIAVAKMEGYSNGEIAENVGCAVRTVERSLSLIRKLWEHE